MVGPIFAEQMEVTMRHHALESGCFVINATGWLTDDQIATIAPDEKHQRALRSGCYTSIISPDGAHLCPPVTEGEGMAVAELDFSLINKRKRMMDSVGHYARPDLFEVRIDKTPRSLVVPRVDASITSADTSVEKATHDTGERLPVDSDQSSTASHH